MEPHFSIREQENKIIPIYIELQYESLQRGQMIELVVEGVSGRGIPLVGPYPSVVRSQA